MSDAFRFDGLIEFERALKAFSQVVERDVTAHVRTLANTLTFNLVMETPQYSGAAASAWRVGIGAPVLVTSKPDFYVGGSVKDQIVVDNPFSKRNRNMQAVAEALANCSAEIGRYELNRGSLFISNGLDYVTWFESGQSDAGKPLRMQNMPHRVIARVVDDTVIPTGA